MKTIPAGNIKYLLLDSKVLERNVERSGRGAPAVVVIEVDGDGAPISRSLGYTASVTGHTSLELFPRGHAMHNQRAAWLTTDEVVLDAEDTNEAPETTAVSAPPPTKPHKPKTKTVKVKD